MNITLLEKALEASTNSIVFTDASGRITYVNPTFVRTTGYEAHEVLGKFPSILKSGKVPKSEYENLWKTIKSGNTWMGTFHNRKKDGTYFWERATIFPVISGEGEITHFASIKEDISAEKHAQEMLKAFAAANRLLLESINLDETIERILGIFGRACGVDRAYLFAVEEEDDGTPATLRIRSEWNSGDFLPQIDNPDLQNLPAEGSVFEEWIERLKRHETISVLSRDLPQNEKALMEAQEIQSLLLVPVHVGERLYGFVGFDDCRTPRNWPEREIDTLLSVSSNIGIALQKKIYQDEIQGAFLKAQESADAALQATAAKSNFLATMSHEIRTPLNGILGMTQILLRENLDPEHRDFLETIHRSGQSLHAIVNDILDLSKIEAGKLEVANLSFYLPPIAREVIDLYRSNATEKGLELRLEVADDFPFAVNGDPDRIRQILSNLVSNALKFTEKGSVVIRLLKSDRSDERYRIEVEDTGIGIDPGIGKNLFQMFTQGDSSTTRKYGGTGLGLAICRRLAEAMKGEIDFESTPGIGSTFHVEFPLHKPSALNGKTSEVQLPLSIETVPSTTPPSRVLLVEDNPVNRRVARLQLKQLGIEVEIAVDGEEALRVYEEQGPFDLIFMDCRMPRLNGFETTERILAKAADRPPYIIALTAASTETDQQMARKAGMKDYLIKPVSQARLKEAIRTFQSTRLR